MFRVSIHQMGMKMVLDISKGILLFKDTCTLNLVKINVSLQLSPLHLRR